MSDNQPVLSYLVERQGEMVELLTKLVDLESPSLDKAAVDRLSGFLAAQLRDLGAGVQILPQAEVGNHVKAQWGQGPGGVLILCHMDTVWEAGTVAERPIRMEEGELFGPGAYDMKGGIVNALWAMRALRQAGKRVPEDVAIVGFDDMPQAETTNPPLTTVRQPIQRAGALAVEMLIDILENGAEPPRRIILPTELVIRASCGSGLVG